MSYKGEGNDTRKSQTTSSKATVSGTSVNSPMGVLKTEKTTDTSSFVKRDKELGISVSEKRVSNAVRKA